MGVANLRGLRAIMFLRRSVQNPSAWAAVAGRDSLEVPQKRKRRPLAMAPVHGQHTGFSMVSRAAQRRPAKSCAISFDASRPSFVGPSASRSRGHVPPLAPSLTGFPAGPWSLGPRRRSRTLFVALAALRSVSGSRLPGRCKVCVGRLCRCLGLFPCARVPQTRDKHCSRFRRESSRANHFSTVKRIGAWQRNCRGKSVFSTVPD